MAGSLICDQCYCLLEFIDVNPDPPANLTTITCAVSYTPEIRNLIMSMKFGGIREAGVVAARIIHYSSCLPEASVVTCVPLHKSREKNRGYNQAKVIAKELAKLLRIEFVELLIRQKATKAQATTNSKTERIANLESAFCLSDSAQKYSQKKIILVDDVYTTGATLSSCADTLLQIKPKEIHGITLSTRA